MLLCEVGKAAADFQVNSSAFLDALKVMGIPTVTIEDRVYFNMPALEKAFFVGCRQGEEDWVFGKGAPDVNKVGGKELALDMGLAGVAHMANTREELRDRLRRMGEVMRRRALKRPRKT